MKDFEESRYNDAFVTLKANTIIADTAIDKLQTTVQQQMQSVVAEYGKPFGYDFIEDRSVKDFIAKRVYVLRFDKYYLTFNFILYKGNNEWKFSKFAYAEGNNELL